MLALWLAHAPPLAAAGAGEREQLEALRARIERVQRSLERTREERDGLREELRDREREIGRLIYDLKRAEDALRTETAALRRLERQQGTRRAELRAQREELARQVRAAYAMGQQEHLKLLLSQQDPAEIGRLRVYHRYVTQARAQRIRQVRQTLAELEELEGAVKARTEELTRLRAEQLRKKQDLERSRSRQAAVLARLEQRAESQAQEVARLERDEQRLSRLVEEVRASVAQLPAMPGPKARFAEFRGRLPRPVPGKVSASFGAAKRIGDLKWKGVFYSTSAGTEVRSVFPGRVAYADWLRGFGLLLIVEHGDGYMTLYGHGDSLFKRVGDWVEAGEVIGIAGTTGGFGEPGLYFEIRHNGDPRNPLEWCRR